MACPLIGVTRDSDSQPGPTDSHFVFYATSVEKAGGRPVPIYYSHDLTLIPKILDELDGIVFSGGDDLDPSLYGQTWHPKAKAIDPRRQRFELALLAEVERRRMPALGICLGIQLMNVYRGGSLIQFLPDAPRANPIEHRKLDATLRRHEVTLAADSLLGKAIAATHLSVNTYHKQAIARLGRGLRRVGEAADGVIEAVEDATLPLFVGVQWHPERLHDEAEHLAIFRLLVDRAGNQGMADRPAKPGTANRVRMP
jgi:putative glutamine amidotransferase